MSTLAEIGLFIAANGVLAAGLAALIRAVRSPRFSATERSLLVQSAIALRKAGNPNAAVEVERIASQ